MKFILAYDERDSTLGNFFNQSATNVKEKISAELHQVEEWTYNKLSRVFVDIKLSLLTSDTFVFVVFSHGHDDKFICGSESFLCCEQDLSSFLNSIFYTFSCRTAIQIGNVLVSSGCNVFIGYKNEIHILTTYVERFVECATIGMSTLIHGGTALQAYYDVIRAYDSAIDDTYSFNPLAASIFRSNRDSLVIYGDYSITIHSILKNT